MISSPKADTEPTKEQLNFDFDSIPLLPEYLQSERVAYVAEFETETGRKISVGGIRDDKALFETVHQYQSRGYVYVGLSSEYDPTWEDVTMNGQYGCE